MGLDEILHEYVLLHEQERVLAEAHGGIGGGRYGGRVTARKILRYVLWWSTVHVDATDYAKICDVCQRMGKPSWRDEIPLVNQVTLQPLDKWEVNFMEPINPPGKRTDMR